MKKTVSILLLIVSEVLLSASTMAMALFTEPSPEPLQPPAAYANLPLVFFDTFDSNNNEWFTGDEDGPGQTGNFQVSNGKYEWLVESLDEYAGYFQVANVEPISDFYAEVEARHISGKKYYSYGIQFLIEEDWDRFSFDICADCGIGGEFAVFRIKNSDYTPLIDWQEAHAINPSGANKLAVLAHDDRIRLFINDELVGTVKKSPDTEGILALSTDIFELARVKMDFDNFLVLDASEYDPEAAELPTPTLTSTSAPSESVAIVDTDSLNVREGPDTLYRNLTGVSKGDQLEILGQAYTCKWLKIKTPAGIVGWVAARLVQFDLACSQIPPASIPPTPTLQPPTATAVPTQAPSGQSINVKIINNTGGTVTLNMTGPATYSFTFGTGTQTINVLKGTYTFTAWGCGGAVNTGSKVLSGGDEWEWFCQ